MVLRGTLVALVLIAAGAPRVEAGEPHDDVGAWFDLATRELPPPRGGADLRRAAALGWALARSGRLEEAKAALASISTPVWRCKATLECAWYLFLGRELRPARLLLESLQAYAKTLLDPVAARECSEGVLVLAMASQDPKRPSPLGLRPPDDRRVRERAFEILVAVGHPKLAMEQHRLLAASDGSAPPPSRDRSPHDPNAIYVELPPAQREAMLGALLAGEPDALPTAEAMLRRVEASASSVYPELLSKIRMRVALGRGVPQQILAVYKADERFAENHVVEVVAALVRLGRHEDAVRVCASQGGRQRKQDVWTALLVETVRRSDAEREALIVAQMADHLDDDDVAMTYAEVGRPEDAARWAKRWTRDAEERARYAMALGRGAAHLARQKDLDGARAVARVAVEEDAWAFPYVIDAFAQAKATEDVDEFLLRAEAAGDHPGACWAIARHGDRAALWKRLSGAASEEATGWCALAVACALGEVPLEVFRGLGEKANSFYAKHGSLNVWLPDAR
jgi:hypothetical protein